MSSLLVLFSEIQARGSCFECLANDAKLKVCVKLWSRYRWRLALRMTFFCSFQQFEPPQVAHTSTEISLIIFSSAQSNANYWKLLKVFMECVQISVHEKEIKRDQRNYAYNYKCNENNYMLGCKNYYKKIILQVQVKHSCGIMLITTKIILAIFWTINKQ